MFKTFIIFCATITIKIRKNKNRKIFNLFLNSLLIKSFVNSFNAVIPMNIKRKKTSGGAFSVIKKTSTTQELIIRTICALLNLLCFFVSVNKNKKNPPIVMFVIPIFINRVVGLYKKTTPAITRIIPTILI